MLDVVRTAQDGYGTAPHCPGLGRRIDWNAMRAATIQKLDGREL